MRWPLRRRAAPATRAEAEARARSVEREVKRPLRKMRQENHFAEALARLLEGRP
jgi:hypothetical protein